MKAVNEYFQMLITYVRDLDLVTLLQMFSKCFNEVLGRDVFNSVSVLVNKGDVLLKAPVKRHSN
jgi:hypothetical protein